MATASIYSSWVTEPKTPGYLAATAYLVSFPAFLMESGFLLQYSNQLILLRRTIIALLVLDKRTNLIHIILIRRTKC